MKKLLILLISIFSFISVYAAEDLAINSKSAILIDYASGEVLYSKNEYEELAPASMTKIASLLIIMEYIDEEKLLLEDEVTISAAASSMGGSQIFLEQGEVYQVSELLKGVIIASGNDAVYALGEKVGGTMDNFVAMMNDKCKSIGCLNSNFSNPHGLDDENHYSSAYDMSLLAKELLKHEKILEYSSIYEEYLTRNDGSKTWLVNTNKIIRYYNGADGLKTGYTSLAGYCLTATAKRNDLRVITVVMGVDNTENRTSDTTSMLDYAFNTFKLYLIRSKDEELGNVSVNKANIDSVTVYLKEDATQLGSINDSTKTYEFDIKIDQITAPIKKNDVVGKADIIDSDGNIIDTVDIIVLDDVEKATFADYLIKNMKNIVGGKNII